MLKGFIIMTTNKLFFLSCALAFCLSACRQTSNSCFEIGSVACIDGLYAPWDSLEDDTAFRCFADSSNFYFYYEVRDSTITLVPNYVGESDVEVEDRVEIFFSPVSSMDEYYVAEIDPLGRVLDYKGLYYRHLDYGWDFSSMSLIGVLTQSGYVVAGKIGLGELEALGLNLGDGFYMGVFRADYRPDMSVNWYSAISTDDKSPDFHKPDMLFKAKINK